MNTIDLKHTASIKKPDERSPLGKLKISFKRYKFLYLLAAPGIIYFIIFSYFPMYFLTVAFKDFDIFKGFAGSPWVGFKNFADLFDTYYFKQAFSNTVILSLMHKAIGFPIPIILALLLNELKNKYFKRTIQSFIYMPHFLSWVIVGGMWITLLSPETGIVNEVLKLFGVEPIYFMIDRKLFRWVLVFTNVWKEAGWATIVYLAAISGVDLDLYESSYIDGANRFKQALHITLPSIMPTIIVVFVLSLAKILNIFEQVFVMYTPIVSEVSETIDTYIYKIGLVDGRISFATAVGLFKNVISLALILITNKIVKKLQGYSII